MLEILYLKTLEPKEFINLVLGLKSNKIEKFKDS